MDVLDLLKKDHAEVTKLFQRFHNANGRSRQRVAENICEELQVHTQVEEELFYPAVREAGDSDLKERVEQALKEHQQAKQEIASIQAVIREGSAGEQDEDLMPMVSSLEQDIEHHVTEEEGEMFPRVRELMDDRQRAEIGRRVRDRKRTLMGEEHAPAGRRRSATTSRRRAASARGGARARTTRAKTRRGRGKSTSTKAKTRSRTKRARAGHGR